MSNIGTVIGWKHNHQAGMSTVDGVITEFPGGIPSQAEQDTWTAEYEAYVAANVYKGLRKEEYEEHLRRLYTRMKAVREDEGSLGDSDIHNKLQ